MVRGITSGNVMDFASTNPSNDAATPICWSYRRNVQQFKKPKSKYIRNYNRLKNFIVAHNCTWFDKLTGATIPGNSTTVMPIHNCHSVPNSLTNTRNYLFILIFFLLLPLFKNKIQKFKTSKFKIITSECTDGSNSGLQISCLSPRDEDEVSSDVNDAKQALIKRRPSDSTGALADGFGEVSNADAAITTDTHACTFDELSVDVLDNCLLSVSDSDGTNTLLEVREDCTDCSKPDVVQPEYFQIAYLLFLLLAKNSISQINYLFYTNLFIKYITMMAACCVSADSRPVEDCSTVQIVNVTDAIKSVSFCDTNAVFSYECTYPDDSFRKKTYVYIGDDAIDCTAKEFDNLLLHTVFTLGEGREPVKGILKTVREDCRNNPINNDCIVNPKPLKIDGLNGSVLDDGSNDTNVKYKLPSNQFNCDMLNNDECILSKVIDKNDMHVHNKNINECSNPSINKDVITSNDCTNARDECPVIKKKVTLADVVSSVPHWAAQLKFAGRKNIRQDNRRTVLTSRNGEVQKLSILLKQLEERENRIDKQDKENNKIYHTESCVFEDKLPNVPKYNYRKLTSASEKKLNQLWFKKYGKVFRNQRLPYLFDDDEDNCDDDDDDNEIEKLLPPRLWCKPRNKIIGKPIDPNDGTTLLSDDELIVLADTGADGCLISIKDTRKYFPNVKLSKWKGPGFISGHSSYHILGQLAACMRFGESNYYIRWCVVEEDTIPILGMDFIEHYNVHHSWLNEVFSFSKDGRNYDVPIYLSPKMVRLVSNAEFKPNHCTDVNVKIINPEPDVQYIIEPSEATTGSLRLFRSLSPPDVSKQNAVATIGNWDDEKVFATQDALVGYAYPVDEVVDDKLQFQDEVKDAKLYSHDCVWGMFKQVYHTREKSFKDEDAWKLYTAAHKHFKANFHVNSIKTYEEYKKSKEKENVANAKIGHQLHPHEVKRARDFFQKWKHAFSLNPRAPKPYKGPEFEIDTGDAVPVKQNPRRYAPWQHVEIDRQVQEMVDGGVVSPCISPWASNLVVTKKKDGTWRVAVDYRVLNAVTRKDSYPLPRVDDTLDALGSSNAKLFSVVDAASGFHQIPVRAADREKLAFVTRNGVYTYNSMPFGVSNGPAVFQRGMDDCLRGLYFKMCLCLVDDIIVWSEDFNSYLENLATVFSRLHDYGFTLKLSKCEFLMESVEFLGYIISPGHISANPAKVEAIRQFAPPNTVKGLQRFLGMVGWYRRFIKNYSEIAAPLYELISSENRISKEKGKNRSKVGDIPLFETNSKEDVAFEKLKLALMTEPVLRMPDFDKTFYIVCDASIYGTGAILAQDHDGFEHPVHFLSKGLTAAERNWHSYELEMLSLIRALKAFEHYIYGYTFVIITDCRALAHWNTTKSVSSKVDRWLCYLQSFDIVFQHRPGRLLFTSDTLSRDERFLNHVEKDQKYLSKVLADDGKLPDEELKVNKLEVGRHRYNFQESPAPVPAPLSIRYTHTSGLDCKKISNVQNNDNASSVVLNGNILHVQRSPKKLEKVEKLSKEVEKMNTSFGPILVNKNYTQIRPYIPPGSFRKKIVNSLHNDPIAGHLGFQRTLQRVASRFWWDENEMEEDVRKVCEKCHACSRIKPRKTKKAPFSPIPINGPWTDVHLDYCELTKTRGYKAILAIIDRYTKWCELVPVKDEEAKTSAAKFNKRVLLRHGTPLCVNTDGDPSFKAEFDVLCNDNHIKHFVGKPYRHTPNGLCERLIRVVEQYLGFYCKSDLSDWPDWVDRCQHAINSGESYATGFSPFRLNYGFECNTPIQNEARLLEGESKVEKLLLGPKLDLIDTSIEDAFNKWSEDVINKDAPRKEEIDKIHDQMDKDRNAAKELIIAAQNALVKRTTPKNQWFPKPGDLVDVRKQKEERNNDADCRWYGPYTVWGKPDANLPNWLVFNTFVGKDADFEVNVADMQPHKGSGKRVLLPMDERHNVDQLPSKKCSSMIQKSLKRCKKDIANFSALDLIGQRIKVFWTQKNAKGWWKGTIVDYEPRQGQHWIKYDYASEDGTQNYTQDLIYGNPARWEFINDPPSLM